MSEAEKALQNTTTRLSDLEAQRINQLPDLEAQLVGRLQARAKWICAHAVQRR